MPSVPVVSVRVPCIDGLEIVTVTPGMTAPLASVIFPLIAPVVVLTVWPDAPATHPSASMRIKNGIWQCSRLMRVLRVSRKRGTWCPPCVCVCRGGHYTRPRPNAIGFVRIFKHLVVADAGSWIQSGPRALFDGVARRGGPRPNHADALLDRDARAERLREALEAFENRPRNLGGRERRHAAIGAPRRVAEVHGMQPDLGDATFFEPARRDDALIPEVAAEGSRVPHRVELRVGRRGGVHLELLVEIARHRLEQIELEDEVAEAVEDRLAAVDLDPADL